MRSSAGVGMTPPNVLGAPKPTSSVMISSTLGAPLGGTMRGAHHAFDCAALSLITPPNFGSGGGSCLPSMVRRRAGEPGAGPVTAALAGVAAPSRRRTAEPTTCRSPAGSRAAPTPLRRYPAVSSAPHVATPYRGVPRPPRDPMLSRASTDHQTPSVADAPASISPHRTRKFPNTTGAEFKDLHTLTSSSCPSRARSPGCRSAEAAAGRWRPSAG